MAELVIKEFKGLHKTSNPLNLPYGAMLVAKNIILERDGIIETRNGFGYVPTTYSMQEDYLQYYNVNGMSEPYKALLNHEFIGYDGSTFNKLSDLYFLSKSDVGTNIALDYYRLLKSTAAGSGLVENIYGTSAPSSISEVEKIYSLDLNLGSTYYEFIPRSKNFNNYLYITGKKIKRVERYPDETIEDAGVMKALSPYDVSLSGSNGIISPGQSVAYRVLYELKKENYGVDDSGVKTVKNLYLKGSPSGRVVISNPWITVSSISKSGKVITVDTAIPHGLSVDDVFSSRRSRTYSSISTITQTGGTATVTTSTNHGYITGDIITIEGAVDNEFNGSFSITVTGATTYTYAITSSNSSTSGNMKSYIDIDQGNGDYIVKSVPSTTQFTYETAYAGDITIDEDPNYDFIQIGKNRDIDLKIPIIDDFITKEYFLKIYRSEFADDDLSIPPSDTLQLMGEVKIKDNYSGSAGGYYIDFTDNVPEELRGEFLYTNQNQETIAKSNDIPPACADLENFKGHMFYANTKLNPRKLIQLLGTNQIEKGTDTFTVGSETYTFDSVEDVANAKIKVFQRVSIDTSGTGSITYSSGDVTVDTDTGHSDVSKKHGLSVGDRVVITGVQEAAFNGVFYVKSLDGTNPDYKFTYEPSVTPPASGTGSNIGVSPGTASQNIEDTVRSILNVLNRDTDSPVYGYYNSSDVDIPGKFELVGRTLDALTFNSTVGEVFTPNPDTTEDRNFENDQSTNRVYFSKYLEPEAVPYAGLNQFDIGGSNNIIFRCIALKDSLFFICSEGVWRLTGDTETSFNVEKVESDIACLGAGTVALLDEQIYFYSNKGVVRVNDNGVLILSEQIRDDISNTYYKYSSVSFSVADKESKKYWLFLNDSTSDGNLTSKGYIFDTKTSSWSEYTGIMPTCGTYFNGFQGQGQGSSDCLIYFPQGIDTGGSQPVPSILLGAPSPQGYGILKQKHSAEYNNIYKYEDPMIFGEVVSVGSDNKTLTIKFDTMMEGVIFNELDRLLSEGVLAGCLIKSNGTTNRATAVVDVSGNGQTTNSSGFTFTLSSECNTSIGEICQLTLPINYEIELRPQDAKDPTTQKIWQEVQIYPQAGSFNYLNYSITSDLTQKDREVFTNIEFLDSDGNEVYDLDAEDSGQSPLRLLIKPGNKRGRTCILRIKALLHRERLNILAIKYLFSKQSKRGSKRTEK